MLGYLPKNPLSRRIVDSDRRPVKRRGHGDVVHAAEHAAFEVPQDFARGNVEDGGGQVRDNEQLVAVPQEGATLHRPVGM